MIVLGLISGIAGLVLGFKLGFLKALVLAVLAVVAIAAAPIGIIIAEFPAGLLLGGMVGSLRRKLA